MSYICHGDLCHDISNPYIALQHFCAHESKFAQQYLMTVALSTTLLTILFFSSYLPLMTL